MSEYTLNTSIQMCNICILSQEYVLMSTTICVVSRLGIPRFVCSLVGHCSHACCWGTVVFVFVGQTHLTLVSVEKKTSQDFEPELIRY